MNPVINKKTISRRNVLLGLSVLGSLSALPLIGFNLSAKKTEKWLSPAGGTTDSFALAWTSPSINHGHLLTGFRGHGMAKQTNGSAQMVMVSRRPGNTGVVMDSNSGKILQEFSSPAHLIMEGHACFSKDGKFLFCSESHQQTHEGIITVRESKNFTLINEFKSGGIGPHEIITMPDGNTLAVANGGLIKDKNGKVINAHEMAPNLTLINIASGKIKQTSLSHESKASIRHIDVSADGIIAMGMQVQRSFVGHNHLIPLTAIQKPNGELITLNTPSRLHNQLNDYVGSVRINSKYRTAAFTSPKGDIALFWNIDSGDFLGHHFFHNVCGLTVSSNEEYFVLSNSAGKIRQIHGQSLVENRAMRQHLPQYQWDNHMLTISR